MMREGGQESERGGMHIHFSEEEFAARQHAAAEAAAAAGFDGLLIFKQESMYYLTGYDTFGFCFFQCLWLGADGRTALLTRAPDLRQAEFTSVLQDIRIWEDAADARPENDLKAMLAEFGVAGGRLGVEWQSYGLPAALGFRLRDALEGFVDLADASGLVDGLRVIKSPAELAYVRKAGELADRAWDEAVRLARPGAFEGDILAAMQGAVWRAGGDDPANEFIVGSGPGALMCRYYSGRRRLDADDQLTLEFAGTWRHYHACLMRTIRIGPPPGRQRYLHDAAVEALDACREALRPGRPVGEVFDAHAGVLDARGLAEHRMNACGYSLGATFAPVWMDSPMFYRGNPVLAVPGMVFFIHIIIFDSDSGLAATSGTTTVVTETGNEPVTHASTDLVVN